MNFRAWAKYSVAFIFFASAFSQPAANPRAQIEIDQGIAHYKNGQFKDATAHLRKALRLDGDSVKAHLYLARVLTEQFEPSVKTPKNLAFATEAKQEFEEVLKRQPRNADGLNGLADLKERTAEVEEARRYYSEAMAADAKNAEAYTALGRLDYRRIVEKMNTHHASTTNPSPTDLQLCTALRTENLQSLDAAIAELKRAVELHPQNGTAAYMLSLAYTARTRMDCGDAKAKESDTKESRVWGERGMQWPSYPEGPVVQVAASL
jgi:tetratricopeptide (TPR) repeat protein